ncbi:PIN domain-containing protein [Bradyrhizobium sp.]|uniref:PIN domain-containing protein n=1 Tax=Bradyrhizobium sp. TaxID=376 RepID=UPI0025C49F1C|nr:PIN domain-containing protein [Bradyrhizobium sp.]
MDACTLYPAPLRDLLLEMATAGLFRAKWTERIHDEWISSLLRDRDDLTRAKLERTKALMNEAVLDCLVSGYESLSVGLDLPDGDDRHVLAAAIHCQADTIVTYNLKDFPQEKLARHRIEPQHPDDFISHRFGIDEVAVLAAARRCRARLKNPRRSAEEYLRALERCGLPQAARHLRDYAEVI